MRRGHRELPVWTASIDLVEVIYALSARWPEQERFGLTAQVRRAATSVPANIAEGAARRGTAELVHFLHIASGSLAELDTHLEVAKRLGYCGDKAADVQIRIDHVHGQLLALLATLKRRCR
jgi:four helix bundle protein